MMRKFTKKFHDQLLRNILSDPEASRKRVLKRLRKKIELEETAMGVSMMEGVQRYNDHSLDEEERDKYYRLNLLFLSLETLNEKNKGE